MIRTQVQIPDELYLKAKRFSREREVSLAEVVRRGLELFLDRYPPQSMPVDSWVLPSFDGGATLVSIEDMKGFSDDDETLRSLRASGSEDR